MAVLLAGAGCGYDTSATFHADGSVTVGVKLLLPKSFLEAGPNTTVHGFSQADIDQANAELASKYPGARIVKVTEGDESGVLVTVPFKNEKDAFAFMTQPTAFTPSSSASGSRSSIDVGNTGGLFVSATHTRSGRTDTYTFKTQAPPLESPSPGSLPAPTADELSSIITITFTLTVPNTITSAPGALFTFDRKTAIWKLSLAQSQTLTATTDSGVTTAGSISSGVLTSSPVFFTAVGLAIALGFMLGMITAWRIHPGPEVVPAVAPPIEPPSERGELG